MKKQTIKAAALIMSGALLMGASPVWADDDAARVAVPSDVSITVNGNTVTMKDAPVNVDGRLYLPLRALADMDNKYVDWDPLSGTAQLTEKARLTGKYTLKNPADLGKGAKMGMGSSLVHLPSDPPNIFYSSTDRGPNGEVDIDGETRRTFPIAAFTPTIYKIALEKDEIKVLESIPLKLAKGVDPITKTPYISGISNIDSDEKPYDETGKQLLPLDPYGLDVEGIAYNPADDTFWLCDEYRPSLVQVKRDGTLLQRLVPAGDAAKLNSPEVPLKETIPAVYAKRNINRGFEGVSITPDGKWMFAVIQNPPMNPDKETRKSRAYRILKLNAATGQAVGEFAYLADDAKSFKGLKQFDIVLSDIVAVNEHRVLVDERDKNAGAAAQLKKIYLADLSRATNILGRFDTPAEGQPALEQMTVEGMEAAGVTPPLKRTIVNLVDSAYPFEKMEGVALVDGKTLAVINDNDFGVDPASSTGALTQLWTFELPYTLK
ncbi:esterase-like activity of phytase family protein [Heliobacterium gestii]|uniref:Esterase-like activity of phytase family protein n=1 Tax=Heliomicrobium gestii TaxID=2699 RepID=A0A845LMD1_HELGE|nr:esterase-like activity of phytase family protein [Heliomicrobium gestii]MBM7868322.1 hypothetical protein [Heliomicrobium gestii]MZP44523.1 esterase-like activity of phytase family protein [Heliomicrobium gestii]